MLYLLDSNIISELRKNKPHGAVLAWFQATRRADIAIPSIVLTELQAGAEITRRQDAAKASQLELWIDEVIRNWEIVPMDAGIARECARIMEGKSKALFEDGLIAATARMRQLTVVTRNVKDFAHFGVPVLNPFLNNLLSIPSFLSYPCQPGNRSLRALKFRPLIDPPPHGVQSHHTKGQLKPWALAIRS